MHNCCHLHAADAVIGIVKAVASRAHGCDASQSCCGKIRLMYGLSAHLKRYGINREFAVFIIIESKVHRQRLSPYRKHLVRGKAVNSCRLHRAYPYRCRHGDITVRFHNLDIVIGIIIFHIKGDRLLVSGNIFLGKHQSSVCDDLYFTDGRIRRIT